MAGLRRQSSLESRRWDRLARKQVPSRATGIATQQPSRSKTSQLPGAGKTAVQSTSAQVLAPSRGLMPSAYPVRKVPGIRRNTSRVIIQRAKLAPSEHLRFPLCKRKLFALQCKIMIHSAGTCRPEYAGINPHLSHSERPSRRLPRIFPRGAGNATRRLLSRVRCLPCRLPEASTPPLNERDRGWRCTGTYWLWWKQRLAE